MATSVTLASTEGWSVQATTLGDPYLAFAIAHLAIAVVVIDTDGTRDVLAIFSPLQYREACEYARAYAERRAIHGYRYDVSDYERALAKRAADSDRFWADHDEHYRTSS